MTFPSTPARRLASIRRFVRSPGDVLTVASLALLGVGIAWNSNPGLGMLVVGLLLVLLTPVGAALRILIRGK